MNGPVELVVFILDGRRFAISLSSVERVIRPVEVTPLPKAPDIVSGVINLQGTIAPVFNLRKRFGLPEKAIGLGDQMIVARTSGRTVSFGVDEVERVLEFPYEKIVPREKIHPEMEYVEGVIKLEDGMVLIHDIDRFLSLDEKKALGAAIKKKRARRAR
ncbi:MAG: chemotaxis protein CheW [Nitrospiraceae bacterium]|nr:chemotaxis protein CheW [Nitrospiraceae bacterium]